MYAIWSAICEKRLSVSTTCFLKPSCRVLICLPSLPRLCWDPWALRWWAPQLSEVEVTRRYETP